MCLQVLGRSFVRHETSTKTRGTEKFLGTTSDLPLQGRKCPRRMLIEVTLCSTILLCFVGDEGFFIMEIVYV